MSKLFSVLIISLLIFGCNSGIKRKNLKIEEKREIVIVEEEIITDTLINKIIEVTPITACNCKTEKFNRNSSTDLTFQNSEYFKVENDSLFVKWSNDSLKNKIRSIRFSGFDTIPSKYSIFKNVENLSIESRNGIYGLDIFSKLKNAHFFGSKISLNTNEMWLDRIEVLFAEKTRFTGLESFSRIPNLNVIYFAYSGFDNFPKDIHKLACLNEITLGVYVSGSINLETLDFSKNKCLKKIEILSWNKNAFSGIPKGLINSNIKVLKINHPNLTEKEKKKIETIKASW